MIKWLSQRSIGKLERGGVVTPENTVQGLKKKKDSRGKKEGSPQDRVRPAS